LGKERSEDDKMPIYMWKKEGKNKKVRKMEEEKTVEELVSKKFWKWKKIFGKVESERIPVQKV